MKYRNISTILITGLYFFAVNTWAAEPPIETTPTAIPEIIKPTDVKPPLVPLDAPIVTPSPSVDEVTTNPKFEFWSGSLGHFAAVGMGGTVNLQGSLLGSSLGTGLLVGILNPSFGYFWKHGFEFTFTPSLSLLLPQKAYDDQPTDGTTIVSRITAGIVYNFSENFRKSSYLRFDNGVALFRSGGQGASTYVASLLYGRRYELASNISYSPSFSIEYMPGTAPNSTIGITLTLIQLSIFLN
ncbi:MAG: hypothetical protein ABIQ95_13045 [Bdellovibrionia bacterium]